jgi:glucosamine--fructose-6-phosphate aminotransferase (isomerizing)
MNPILAEINEIPLRASEFLKHSPDFKLPLKVPYLGMGSSYFAPLAFKYMGIDIHPEFASEYYNYIKNSKKKRKTGVIISQSGQSSEAVWCTELFSHYIAITNDAGSTLAKNPKATGIISLFAGNEQYSSSKTYINTLLALFRGFGFNAPDAAVLLSDKIRDYDNLGRKMAVDIFNEITRKKVHGIYILGNGPNVATAYEAALIMSENTKLCFSGMPVAQYDHGAKETAANSIVIQILARGKSRDRAENLSRTISKSGALVMTVEEPDADENFSIVYNIIPFNFMAVYLAGMLNVTETFAVGGKITTTS